MKAKFATFIIPFIFFNNPLLAQDYCSYPQKYYDEILTEVANKNPNVIENLPECLKQDRTLIFKVLLIDKSQFQNVSENLHEDKIFIKRIIKENITKKIKKKTENTKLNIVKKTKKKIPNDPQDVIKNADKMHTILYQQVK
jgi:hypothetical protein